jgi:hypothetical protein
MYEIHNSRNLAVPILNIIGKVFPDEKQNILPYPYGSLYVAQHIIRRHFSVANTATEVVVDTVNPGCVVDEKDPARLCH